MFLKKSYQNSSRHLLKNSASLVERKWQGFISFIQENKQHGIAGIPVAFYREYTLEVVVAGLSLVFVSLSLIVLSIGPEQDKQNIFVEAQDELSGSYSSSSLEQLKQVNSRYILETSAHAVIYDKNWKKQNIVDLSNNWNNLSRQQKREIKQTVWFQLLENALIQKLKTNQVKVGNNSKGDKLLVALSEKLNIQIPADQDATVYKTGLASASAAGGARNKAEEKKTVVKAKTVALTVTDIKPLIIQDKEQQGEAEPALAQVEIPQQEVSQAVSAQPQLEQGAVSAETSQEQNNTMEDLQVAQLDNVAQPVDQDPYAPDMMVAAKPLNNIELSSTKKGRVIRFDNTQSAEQENAQRADQDKEPQIVASARNIPIASKTKPGSAAAADSALNEITSLFASSYETGNIKVFASLFAAEAVSNDAQNLAAIKSEYQSLFKSTSDRLMTINNMKWDFVNDTAIGDGELQVSVRANDSEQKQSFSGIIHFEIKKKDDDWQITKLYHAIN